ncbi:MAG: HlyD family type I secretion periplasmic adaptor subunit [Pseudomonadota bacterium]
MPRTRKNNETKLFAAGWLLIIGLFGGIGLWSFVAPFEGAVIASGIIAAETKNKSVQHLEGGIVGAILVTEGDFVEKSELLLRLDDAAVKATLASIDARLSDLIAREGRLIAQRDDDEALRIRKGLEALIRRPDYQANIAAQAALLKTQREREQTQISILTQRMEQLKTQARGLNAEAVSKQRQLNLIKEEIDDLTILLEKGLTAKPRVLALQREAANLAGAKEALLSEIAATKVKIGETELEIIGLTEGIQEETLGELTDVQGEISDLLERRFSAADKMTRLDVRAPQSGQVVGVKAHTVGGVIAAADPIMFIVPKEDDLVARVRVKPQDVDNVSVGQKAELRFSAFSQAETVQYNGVVTRLSGDVMEEPETGMPYYEADVAFDLPEGSEAIFNPVPGMPVDSFIVTGSRTVISYLTKPIQDSFARMFRE